MKALVVLKPSASKRLIGRAVAEMTEVRQAYKQGRIIIAGGTTNAFIVDELLDTNIHKGYYTAGIVSDGKLTVTDEDKRLKPISLVNGQPVDQPWNEILNDFTKGDLFIKGANAIDVDGNVGVIVADRRGGTIGLAYGTVIARGATFICPVSIGKLVPDVFAGAAGLGTDAVDLVMGMPVGMIPLSIATVITEIEAFDLLFGVMAMHVASAGSNGSEGAVVVLLEGDDEQVRQAYDYVETIQFEPNITLDPDKDSYKAL